MTDRDYPTTLCESCGSPCRYVGPGADSYCPACLAEPWWQEPNFEDPLVRMRDHATQAECLLADKGYLELDSTNVRIDGDGFFLRAGEPTEDGNGPEVEVAVRRHAHGVKVTVSLYRCCMVAEVRHRERVHQRCHMADKPTQGGVLRALNSLIDKRPPNGCHP